MKLTVTSVKTQQSAWGGVCHLITFKKESGKSCRTWVYDNCGNSRRWQPIIQQGKGTVIDGVTMKNDNLVDADSFPTVVTFADQMAFYHPEGMK